MIFVHRWRLASEIFGQVREASGTRAHELQSESPGQQTQDRPEMAAAEHDDPSSALGKGQVIWLGPSVV